MLISYVFAVHGLKLASAEKHCQKSGTRWQPSMSNAVQMPVSSCKKMYDERKNLANISVASSRVFIARL